jgi:hypothetical protein
MLWLTWTEVLLTLPTVAGMRRECHNANHFLSFFLFYGMGVLTQDLHPEPIHQPFFVMGVFEIGSCKLFAWAGFKPQSS